MVLDDSYPSSNYAGSSTTFNVSRSFGQSFMSGGGSILRASFLLRRTGSPIGNAVAKLYAHTGTFGSGGVGTGAALATSDPISLDSIATSFAMSDFDFSTSYLMQAGTAYAIVVEVTYSFSSGSDYISIGFDSSSPSHAGNEVNRTGGGSWSSDTRDRIFAVYVPESGYVAHTVDAEIEAPPPTRVHSVSSYVLHPPTEIVHSFSSVLIASGSETHTTNGLLQGAQTKVHSLDALLRTPASTQHSLSASIDRDYLTILIDGVNRTNSIIRL